MKPEQTLTLKIAALQLAADARTEHDDMGFVYEQAQAMYEWLAEDFPEGTNLPTNVSNLRPVN